MRNPTRTLLLALGLTLAWALPASAANWAAPTLLSPAGASVGSSPSVAIDDAGFGVTTWADTVAGKSIVRVAQHAPGGAWATLDPPLSNGVAGDACNPYASIDPSGNAMVVWAQFVGPGCGSGNQQILFSTRIGGSGAWSAPTPVGLSNPQAEWQLSASSNANGQMMIAWTVNDMTSKFVVGAVGSPTGGFSAATALGTYALQNSLYYLTTAIGPSGDAAAQWTVNNSGATTIAIATKSSTGSFPSPVNPTNLTTGANGGSIAIDPAGDVLTTYLPSAGTTIVSRYRPAGSTTFGGAQTVGTTQSGYLTSSVAVGVDGAGNAAASWVETDFGSATISPYTRRLFTVSRPAGSSSPWSGAAPLTDQVSSSEPNNEIAVSSSGAITVAWDERVGTEDDAVVFYRPPGGSYGGATSLGQGAGATVAVSPAGDAITGYRGSVALDARVSVLDVHPPVVTAMNVPATANAGASVPMTAAATDLWAGLPAGQPVWAFGDGVTATGAATAHTYTKAGTYTVTLTTSDGSGNAAAPVTRTITIAAAPGGTPTGPTGPTATLPKTTTAKPKLKAAYVASKLVGTVALSGTSAAATILQIQIRRSGAKKVAVTLHLAVKKAGRWSKAVTLPKTLTPGKYGVAVSGKGVTGSSTSFTIAAPKSGIVNRAYASGPRHGPTVTKIAGTSELWAHFHFGTLPKTGQAITTQWTLPNGTKLAANTRPRTGLVEAQVKDLKGRPLPTGLWRCVIRAGGTVVATLSVRLT